MYENISHKMAVSLNVINMIKGLRDLNVLNLEHLTNVRTNFCIDHSKMNVINLEPEEGEEEVHLYGCEQVDFAEKLEKYILEEKNKIIYRKRFKFDLGEPDLGVELPEGMLGGKKEEVKDEEAQFYIKAGDKECLEDHIRDKLADRMHGMLT